MVMSRSLLVAAGLLLLQGTAHADKMVFTS